MKFIDFFAGVGGFRRGMELAGHECVGFCEFDKFATASYTSMHLLTPEQRDSMGKMPLKQRQKEILKEEYRDGEWYANDIRRVYAGDIPKADCWCFGFPCQDISVAGKQLGFKGNRSSLFFRVMYLIGQLEEEDKPTYLFIENVKNLLSVNGGWDFARMLIEMEQRGYDAEWQVLNSKNFGVPQNRERVFIIGHLRSRGSAEVFPVEGTNRENSVSIIGHRDKYRRNMQVFAQDGITEALSTCQGGGREHHIALPCFIDLCNEGSKMTDQARCLKARYYKGASNHAGQDSGIVIEVREAMNAFSEDREQGIFVKISEELVVYAVWYEKYQCYIAIRKLTPRECFKLQGWTDDYFEKAAFVSSDSQLYKQAGNGVTVTVIEAIAKKLGRVHKIWGER